MDTAIRRAEVEDAEEIAACLGELGYGTGSAVVREKLDSLAASPFDAFLVACEPEGRIVGAIALHLLPLFHAPGDLARITALAVRSDAQGRGVGRQLVAAAERIAWKAGCERIEVTSADHRSAAHRFYEDLGYRSDERRFIKTRGAGS
jgi:GNAT superfamily N-acetyltransferase